MTFVAGEAVGDVRMRSSMLSGGPDRQRRHHVCLNASAPVRVDEIVRCRHRGDVPGLIGVRSRSRLARRDGTGHRGRRFGPAPGRHGGGRLSRPGRIDTSADPATLSGWNERPNVSQWVVAPGAPTATAAAITAINRWRAFILATPIDCFHVDRPTRVGRASESVTDRDLAQFSASGRSRVDMPQSAAVPVGPGCWLIKRHSDRVTGPQQIDPISIADVVMNSPIDWRSRRTSPRTRHRRTPAPRRALQARARARVPCRAGLPARDLPQARDHAVGRARVQQLRDDVLRCLQQQREPVDLG